MANTILHKRSSTASAIPSSGSLTAGELAINTADGKVYTKKADGSVVEVSSNASHSHSAADITSGTLANARTTATDADTASSIVLRSASNAFTVSTIQGGSSGLALLGSVRVEASKIYAAGTVRSFRPIYTDGNIQTATGNTVTGTQLAYAIRYDGAAGSATTCIITNGGLLSGSSGFWHPTILFPGGVKPTLTTSGIDIITFVHDGTNVYGFLGGLAFA
jgi:hypothetical protein